MNAESGERPGLGKESKTLGTGQSNPGAWLSNPETGQSIPGTEPCNPGTALYNNDVEPLCLKSDFLCQVWVVGLGKGQGKG